MNDHKDKNYKYICRLFSKTITALAYIISVVKEKEIKDQAKLIIEDLLKQYGIYRKYYNSFFVGFIYDTGEISDFANECYDKEYFYYAEDVEYGYIELLDKIIEERENLN